MWNEVEEHPCLPWAGVGSAGMAMPMVGIMGNRRERGVDGGDRIGGVRWGMRGRVATNQAAV